MPGGRGRKIRKLRPIVLVRDGCRCVYCGWTPPREYDVVRLVLDHVVPRCRGGKDTLTNLVTACFDCNARKGAKSVAAFLSKRRAA